MIGDLQSLLAPLTLIVIVSVALALLACHRDGKTWRCVAACLGVLVVYVPCTPLFANWVLGGLEHRAVALRRCAPPLPGSVIIVLAGGVHGDPAGPRDDLDLSDASIRRTLAATRLALRTPSAELVVSGGAGGKWREADLMATLARSLGLAAARVREDRDAMTTYGSAVDLRRQLAGDTRARYLVTSAYHMPRAWMSFHAVGLPVCAWPVDFRAFALQPWQMLLPQITALAKTGLALHEWLGMIVYQWVKFKGSEDSRGIVPASR